MSGQLPFFTRALFEYKSGYEDDLSFSSGQLIRITAIEDEEWYSGEYTDGEGVLQSGMFPKNFVGEAIAEESVTTDNDIKDEPGNVPVKKKEVAEEQSTHDLETAEVEDCEDQPIEQQEDFIKTPVFKTVEPDSPITQNQESAPVQQVKVTKRPSVSEGFSSRISTFDSGAPVPSLLNSNPFGKIHKSDVKPYQGHSSYIPPALNQTPTKTKQEHSHSSYVPPLLGKEDRPAALIAPPVEADTTNDHAVEEGEGPKLSLKERIALLQKQQAEEAERQAALAAKKKQQKEAKSAAANAAQHHEIEETEVELVDVEPVENDEPAIPKISESPNDETKVTQANDDEPETTEDKEVLEEDDEDDEDDDEDEEDEEEAKRTALRERMAKLAGAGGIYGAPGGFNPFGMPSGAPTAKKSTKKTKPKTHEVEAYEQPVAVPILPFAGGSAPQIPEVLRRQSIVNEEVTSQQQQEPREEDIDEEIVDSSDEGLETVKENSPVELETAIEEDDEEPEKEEAKDLPLVQKLENLDLNPSSGVIISESAVEGDDEEGESSSEDFSITEKERQREIQKLNLDSSNLKHLDPSSSAIQSDYTTGYESDDDSQFPKAQPSTNPPPIPSLDIVVTPVKKSAAPPPPHDAARIPESSAPPIPETRSSKAPPPPPPASIPDVPALSLGAPPLPAVPPPIPSNIPPPPADSIIEPQDDAKSVNSSIISPDHDSHAPSLPQIPIPENEPLNTPSRQLKNSHTGQSITSLRPSNTGQSVMSSSSANYGYSTPIAAQFSGSGIKKASTFTQGSISSNKISESDSNKFDLDSKWWLKNELPNFLQSNVNKDLIFEIEENRIKRRDGHCLIVKDYYILHQDNSQTVLYLTYSDETVENSKLLSFESVFKPCPNFNQNFLDTHSKDYGFKVLKIANGLINSSLSTPLIPYILQKLSSDEILPNVGLRSYGATIYSNSNNVEINQFTSFKPGDILAINKAKFQGHNKLRQKVIYDVGMDKSGPTASVLTEFDFEKKKFRVIEVDSKGKVKQSSYKPSDMKSGKIKVFRVVDRGYISW